MGLILSRKQPPKGVQPWPADRVDEVHPSKLHQITRIQYDDTKTLDDVLNMEKKFFEEEEEVTRKVNPFTYCFLYFLLCCQPIDIKYYELPQSWQRPGLKETICVDLRSRQYSKRRRCSLLLRGALYIKHLLEVHFVNFGFRHFSPGGEEFQV